MSKTMSGVVVGNFCGCNNVIFQLLSVFVNMTAASTAKENTLDFQNNFWFRCAISILMN